MDLILTLFCSLRSHDQLTDLSPQMESTDSDNGAGYGVPVSELPLGQSLVMEHGARSTEHEHQKEWVHELQARIGIWVLGPFFALGLKKRYFWVLWRRGSQVSDWANLPPARFDWSIEGIK